MSELKKAYFWTLINLIIRMAESREGWIATINGGVAVEQVEFNCSEKTRYL